MRKDSEYIQWNENLEDAAVYIRESAEMVFLSHTQHLQCVKIGVSICLLEDLEQCVVVTEI